MSFTAPATISLTRGWSRVKARLGRSVEYLEAGLKAGRILREKRPVDWTDTDIESI